MCTHAWHRTPRNKRKVGRLPPAFEKTIPITSNRVWPIRALTAGVVDKQSTSKIHKQREIKQSYTGENLITFGAGFAGCGRFGRDGPRPTAAPSSSCGGELRRKIILGLFLLRTTVSPGLLLHQGLDLFPCETRQSGRCRERHNWQLSCTIFGMFL
jgi:hypothetical protein